LKCGSFVRLSNNIYGYTVHESQRKKDMPSHASASAPGNHAARHTKKDVKDMRRSETKKDVKDMRRSETKKNVKDMRRSETKKDVKWKGLEKWSSVLSSNLSTRLTILQKLRYIRAKRLGASAPEPVQYLIQPYVRKSTCEL
jgi:hypothetical protein